MLQTWAGERLSRASGQEGHVPGQSPRCILLSHFSSQVLCEGEQERVSRIENGQHEWNHVCERPRRHSVTELNLTAIPRIYGCGLAVPAEGHNSKSQTFSRGAEHS